MKLLDDEFYRKALAMEEGPRGGQELILLEILAALRAQRCLKLWLPFSLGHLARVARSFRFTVYEHELEKQTAIDALYFGTPTIVDGKKLFEESHEEEWDVAKERATVAKLCLQAQEHGAWCIVSGLGTGDISVNERCADMMLKGWTLPQVVCTKRFGDFTDHVILTFRDKA